MGQAKLQEVEELEEQLLLVWLQRRRDGALGMSPELQEEIVETGKALGMVHADEAHCVDDCDCVHARAADDLARAVRRCIVEVAGPDWHLDDRWLSLRSAFLDHGQPLECVR